MEDGDDMEQTPSVSIIMPVYNSGAYLHDSIGSVLAQTCADFELILIDDGSRDDSPAICRSFAERDSRIRLLHKENGGQGAARNDGLDLARGEYILFVDSDDTIEKDCLEQLLEIIRQHDSDAVIFNFDYLTGQGDILEDGGAHPIRDGLYSPDDIFRMSCEKNGYVLSLLWNKLIRRSCFADLRFTRLRMCEDEVIFPELMDRCRTICMTSQVLYHYFRRSGSVMRQSFSARNFDQLFAYCHRYRFYLDTDRQALAHIAGKGYWENLRIHFLRHDLTDRTLRQELKNAEKQFRSVAGDLMRNPLLTRRDKLHLALFFTSPVVYKQYILFRSK